MAHIHRHLFAPTLRHDQLPAPSGAPEQAPDFVVDPLKLSGAEIATEMYVSINTIKTHRRNIYRKLAAALGGEAVRRARQPGLI